MNISRAKKLQQKRLGATLIEVVVSSLLVAIVLVTSLRSTAVIHSSTMQTDENVLLEIAANSLLEELRALRYKEDTDSTTLGPDGNESLLDRTTWDDCDDAVGFSTNRLSKRDGIPYGNGNIFARINGQWIEPETLSPSSLETGLKSIEIIVGNDRSGSVAITALFTETPQREERSVTILEMNVQQTDGNNLSLLASPRNRASIESP